MKEFIYPIQVEKKNGLNPTWQLGWSMRMQTALRMLMVKNGTQQIKKIPEKIQGDFKKYIEYKYNVDKGIFHTVLAIAYPLLTYYNA